VPRLISGCVVDEAIHWLNADKTLEVPVWLFKRTQYGIPEPRVWHLKLQSQHFFLQPGRLIMMINDKTTPSHSVGRPSSPLNSRAAVFLHEQHHPVQISTFPLSQLAFSLVHPFSSYLQEVPTSFSEPLARPQTWRRHQGWLGIRCVRADTVQIYSPSHDSILTFYDFTFGASTCLPFSRLTWSHVFPSRASQNVLNIRALLTSWRVL
jgi:hypothetical protein